MVNCKSNLAATKKIFERGGSISILVSPSQLNSKHLILGVSELPPGEVIKPHVHDYSEEAFFVLNGSGQICFEDEDSVDFTEGDAVIVQKGKPHWIKNTATEVLKVIFAAAPLAPSPQEGHREIIIEGDLK